MDQKTQHYNANQVHVVLFKDQYYSRTFKVSFLWLKRLSIFLSLGLLITLCIIAFSLKFAWRAKKNSLEHIRQLEAEIGNLKETKNVPAPLPTPPTIPAQNLPDPSTLPIRVMESKALWKGSFLEVSFNIQYIKEDGGNQQGTIVVLALGSDCIFSYPPGSLNKSDIHSLIHPSRGESFSVSHFRAGEAKFGPFSSHLAQEVQILIYNKENKILLIEKLTPISTPKAKPKAAPSAIPQDSPQGSPQDSQ